MTDLDLFGDPTPPRRTDTDYFLKLARMNWPPHLEFWCLSAEPRPKRYPAETTEMVCFRSKFLWVHAAVNITTGQVLSRVRVEPLHATQKRGRKRATPAS